MWEDFTDTLYILQKINLNLNSYKQLYCTAVESKTFPETETKKQKRRDKPKKHWNLESFVSSVEKCSYIYSQVLAQQIVGV